ncbi:MAG: C40 family peptidase [Lachnospiraceae bacterium]|nr:C40 family peptidase [Lachnospiraceae bacterium]
MKLNYSVNQTKISYTSEDVVENIFEVNGLSSVLSGNRMTIDRGGELSLSIEDRLSGLAKSKWRRLTKVQKKKEIEKASNLVLGTKKHSLSVKDKQKKAASYKGARKVQNASKTVAKDKAADGISKIAAAPTSGTSEVVNQGRKVADKVANNFRQNVQVNEKDDNKKDGSLATILLAVKAAVAMAVSAVTTAMMPIILMIAVVSIIFTMLLTSFTSLFGSLGDGTAAVVNQMMISESVLKYQKIVHKECLKNGINEEYEQYIYIIMDIESHGEGDNPMQYTNAIPGNPKMTPELSIKYGVEYFGRIIKRGQKKKADLFTMIHAYNYGIGFIDYIEANGNKYTDELAQRFSDEQAKKLNVKRYGDKEYVHKFQKYFMSDEIDGLSDSNFKTIYEEASKYKGRAYVWGGETPEKGFDCSGLTKWCYKKIGIDLPHSAQGQYNLSSHITIENAEPGDLVFFTGTYETSNYITHVEIYIGNNKSIGAGDPIGIHDLTKKYYKEHYVCCGRLMKK